MEENNIERIRRSSRNKRSKRKNEKSKSNKNSIIILLLLPIALVVGYYFYIISSPLKAKSSVVTITVKEADTLNSVLDSLEASKNLKNKLIVKLNLKLSKKAPTLMPGVYEVETKSSLKELLNSLKGGENNANKISLAIPEGFTIDKIAERIEEEGLASKSEFLQAIKDYELPSYVKKNPKKTYDLEGYLYPDTYYVDKNTTPEIIIGMMISTFETRLEELESEVGVKISDSDIEDLIIRASLVEKEAVLDDERGKVASVIKNRLAINMNLGFCSTVNYVIGYDGRQTLTYDQIAIDSPYNTYKYAGLPIGPICSPGKESLEAAMKPDDTNYLYFVALKDQGGKQYFSTTLAEHERVSKEQGY